jgi:pimeloyl-ACP methyl ester carboxylesterase
VGLLAYPEERIAGIQFTALACRLGDGALLHFPFAAIRRIEGTMSSPQSRFYESQDLRLHYVDWGNQEAPPLILIHGGRDHCRSWDTIAQALQPHFHVLAPDLRGHGDSDWTKGGSYALPEYVYDLTRLVRIVATCEVTIIGHSMGGMVGLIYSGSFPDKVSTLVVLDGTTVLPDTKRLPPHERITKWVGQLDNLHDRAPRRYRTIEEAAAQMRTHNNRLSRWPCTLRPMA